MNAVITGANDLVVTVNNVNREASSVYNVVFYGATGNGSTDDTAAIVAALAAAKTVKGTVYFPKGTYLISSALTLDGDYHGVSLVGEGPGASVIKVKATYSIIAAIWLQTANHVTIKGLEIDCNKANVPDNHTDVFQFGIYGSVISADVTDNVLDNVLVHDCHGCGIKLTGFYSPSTYQYKAKLRDVRVADCGMHGIWIPVANDYSLLNCEASGSGSAGLVLGGSKFDVTGGSFHTNGSHGVSIDVSATKFSISGTKCYDNTYSGISLTYLTSKFAITNNVCTDNGWHGIAADLAQPAPNELLVSDADGVIVGNVCTGNDGTVTSHGIFVQYCANVAVSKNTCVNNYYSGIELVGNRISADGNVCHGNRYGLYFNEVTTPTPIAMGNNSAHGNLLHTNSVANWANGCTEPVYRLEAHSRGTAAPSAGTWVRGDIVWNSEPSAAGSAGWICVTAGTPGTWKAFGTIAS